MAGTNISKQTEENLQPEVPNLQELVFLEASPLLLSLPPLMTTLAGWTDELEAEGEDPFSVSSISNLLKMVKV